MLMNHWIRTQGRPWESSSRLDPTSVRIPENLGTGVPPVFPPARPFRVWRPVDLSHRVRWGGGRGGGVLRRTRDSSRVINGPGSIP